MRKITKSFEDYLEAIYLLKRGEESSRVTDVAESLGVKLPSVTGAVKKLSKMGLVDYERYGRIKLTKAGEKVAKEIYKKHKIIYLFLKKILKVEKKRALREACLIEHIISRSTLRKLSKFVKDKINGGE